MISELFEIELNIYVKMDLALNNQQRLNANKTETKRKQKENQTEQTQFDQTKVFRLMNMQHQQYILLRFSHNVPSPLKISFKKYFN